MLVVVALDSASNVLESMIAFDADDARRVKDAMTFAVEKVDRVMVWTLAQLWQHECKLARPFA